MLKVIPVEQAVGLPLAHDITEIIPENIRGRRFGAAISFVQKMSRNFWMSARPIFMS